MPFSQFVDVVEREFVDEPCYYRLVIKLQLLQPLDATCELHYNHAGCYRVHVDGLPMIITQLDEAGFVAKPLLDGLYFIATYLQTEVRFHGEAGATTALVTLPQYCEPNYSDQKVLGDLNQFMQETHEHPQMVTVTIN